MLTRVTANKEIAPNVYDMYLEGEVGTFSRPGQFVQMAIDGFYLRRPLSVCDWGEGFVRIIYKTVGLGTEKMSEIQAGEEIDILSPLGNGFDVSLAGEQPLIIGGGVGIPPMYGLAKALVKAGKIPTVILGFNTSGEIFLQQEFEALGIQTMITTVDGTVGTKGFVTEAMKQCTYSYFYACGPEGMLKAVCEASHTQGELSFEERMACGFGACMGCTCKTKYGYKRICKDGPVLSKEEVIW